MYTIVKQFTFDAAHQLYDLPVGHKCGNLHGHTYTVKVGVWAKELSKEGWIFDFNDFAPFKNYIDTVLDHRNLNIVLAPMQTTSENLARYLYDRFEALVPLPTIACIKYVRVSETASTYAEYSR